MGFYDTPNFATVRPLEYGPTCGGGGRGDASSSACLLAGVVVIGVYLMMNSSSPSRSRYYYTMDPRAIGSAIASMAASVIAGSTNTNGVRSLNAIVEGAPNNMRLIDANATNALGDTDATEAMTDDEKEANERKLREWLADPANHKACIMLFAHWCPHCKTMMTKMVEVANANKDSDTRFLVVNADSVKSSAFNGKDAVHDLKFFPTILCKVGSMGKQVGSPEEAVELIKESEADDAAGADDDADAAGADGDADAAGADGDAGEVGPASTSAMLSMLF
jgi:thiol-disulfide isomerase/thioredoxin